MVWWPREEVEYLCGVGGTCKHEMKVVSMMVSFWG